MNEIMKLIYSAMWEFSYGLCTLGIYFALWFLDTCNAKM